MKKTILLLLFGSFFSCYGQQADSSEKVRKWIFKSKTDTVTPKIDTLFKSNKPFEETFFGRNKIDLYADFTLGASPIGNQNIYKALPFTKVGFIKNKKMFFGVGFVFGAKGKYTDNNISTYPTFISATSLDFELGYHILPEKLIHFSPYISINHSWLSFNKGVFKNFYIDDDFHVVKDRYWNFQLGTDVFLNITDGLRLGLNINYNNPLSNVISESITDKLKGVGYGVKFQFHTSFLNKKQ